MPQDDPPQSLPALENASIAVASDLHKDQIQRTEEAIQDHFANGVRVPVRPPPPLTVSGRVLVATFLLPYEGTIDLEGDGEWVKTPPISTFKKILIV
jgi:hypothetical protein